MDVLKYIKESILDKFTYASGWRREVPLKITYMYKDVDGMPQSEFTEFTKQSVLDFKDFDWLFIVNKRNVYLLSCKDLDMLVFKGKDCNWRRVGIVARKVMSRTMLVPGEFERTIESGEH